MKFQISIILSGEEYYSYYSANHELRSILDRGSCRENRQIRDKFDPMTTVILSYSAISADR